MKVNILEAKNRLSQLIKSAQAGEDVVIANRGEPVARLIAVPDAATDSARAGTAGGIIDWLDKNPLPAHLRRTHGDIEAGIRKERAAWD